MLTKLADKLVALYNEQTASWDELREACLGLKDLQRKSLSVAGQELIVQYNPRRAASTLARIDTKSIAARPCFLCPHNLPKQQNGFILADEYLVLCNPRPIFERHFTVSHIEHTPQVIAGREKDYFRLLAELGSDYALLFNGAKAGASAPDHLHFQICPTKELPIFHNIDVSGNGISQQQIWGVTYRVIVAEDIQSVIEDLQKIGQYTLKYDQDLLNIIGTVMAGRFTVIVCLRAKHRPSCYEAGEDSLKISPAAVEMAGVIITARSTDYERLDAAKAGRILKEVVLTD